MVLPVNNPAQKEPAIAGSDPAAQPTGPAALPNPPPPDEKEPVAQLKATKKSGKGKGQGVKKEGKTKKEVHDKSLSKGGEGYNTIKEKPIE